MAGGFTIIVVASVLVAFLYHRAPLLMTFYANHPSRFPLHNSLGEIDILFPDIIRNCEDVILEELEGWALFSCDPGRDRWNTVMGTFIDPNAPAETGIYIYNYAGASSAEGPQLQKLQFHEFSGDATDFHPLGLEFEPSTNTLFVINHAFSGSRIDVFRLSHSRDILTYTGSLRDDSLLAAPNSLQLLSPNEFLVTNDHYVRSRVSSLLSQLETYLGAPGGTVTYVKLDAHDTLAPSISMIKNVARLPFANGVKRLNASTIAVASSSTAKVQLYTTVGDGDGFELVPSGSFFVPFAPDNLSVDGKGNLLIAGHPHVPSLTRVAKNAAYCQQVQASNVAGEAPTAQYATRCGFDRLSWFSELKPGQSQAVTLYAGKDYGFSTTAVRDVTRGIGFATGLYEKGVLSWRF